MVGTPAITDLPTVCGVEGLGLTLIVFSVAGMALLTLDAAREACGQGSPAEKGRDADERKD